MGFLRCGVVGASLLAAGVQALAVGETRTLWYDVPNTGTYPNTSVPSFPPSNAALSGLNGSWDTYFDVTMTPRNISTSLSAGLRVPNLGQLFDDLSVGPLSQGNLTQIDLVVVTYSRTVFTFTNTTGAEQTGLSASVNANLDINNFVSPAPPNTEFNPIGVLGSGNLAAILQQPTVTGVTLPAGVNNTATAENFVLTTNTFSFTSGANFTALASQVDAFTALPMLYRPSATSSGSGNYSVAAVTFGAAAVGITYSFVPESDLAWAGLPLVAGGWLIRRRMIAGKKA
jgi:hypothetical protein